MLVFKCSKCGEIYRKNEVPNDEICTTCGSYLKVVNINDDVNPEGYHMNDNLSSGVKSNVGRIRTESSQTRTLESGLNYRNETSDYKYQSSRTKTENYEKEEHRNRYSMTRSSADFENENSVEGTIISAINDDGYRRLPWKKLYERYAYSQNVGNIQNSIYIRCVDKDGNVSNKTIIKYGQIRGGIGLFRTGMRIKAEGKVNKKNEIMAKKIILEDNIIVSTRTEMADIFYYASPLLFILIGILIFNIKSIFKGIISSGYLKWYVISIICTFFATFFLLGRVVRVPIVNRFRTCTWVSLILGTVVFFVIKSIFAP